MQIKFKNRTIHGLVSKLLGIKTLNIRFLYDKSIADNEISEFSFLNQSLMEFEELSDEFKDKIRSAMETAPKE